MWDIIGYVMGASVCVITLIGVASFAIWAYVEVRKYYAIAKQKGYL